MFGPSLGLGLPMFGPTTLLFSPATINANLELWLDASDASSVTATGSSVSQWDDKSPAGAHAFQSTASNQPQTGTRTISGRNAIGFDGALHWLDLPNETISYDTSLVVCVFEPDVIHGDMIIANQGPDGDRFYVRNQRVNFGDLETSLPSPVSGSAVLQSAWVSGTGISTQFISLNGATATSATVTRTGTNINQSIGSRNGSSGFLEGAIGELIVVAGDGSIETRQRLEGYLAHKWGIAADLDPAHPYISEPPKA